MLPFSSPVKDQIDFFAAGKTLVTCYAHLLVQTATTEMSYFKIAKRSQALQQRLKVPARAPLTGYNASRYKATWRL
jgi:hypothetical protein